MDIAFNSLYTRAIHPARVLPALLTNHFLLSPEQLQSQGFWHKAVPILADMSSRILKLCWCESPANTLPCLCLTQKHCCFYRVLHLWKRRSPTDAVEITGASGCCVFLGFLSAPICYGQGCSGSWDTPQFCSLRPFGSV